MMHRIFTVIVVVPIAIPADRDFGRQPRNRRSSRLDPFNPGNPALSVQVPLFVLLLLTLVLGLIAGSALTWFKQHKYRKAAREKELKNQRAASRDTALSTRSA